jgi:chromosome partitioning protein
VEPRDGAPTLAAVLDGRGELSEAAVPVEAVPGLSLVPADLSLSRRERELRDPGRLRAALGSLARCRTETVLVDTPPAWSLLTVNALVAVREIFAPVEPKTLSMGALVELVRMVEDVRRELNPGLTLAGVIPSRVQRTRLAREALEDLARHFPKGNILPLIRESARVAEAPGFHLPVSRYAPDSIGAEDFKALTRAVLRLGA